MRSYVNNHGGKKWIFVLISFLQEGIWTFTNVEYNTISGSRNTWCSAYTSKKINFRFFLQILPLEKRFSSNLWIKWLEWSDVAVTVHEWGSPRYLCSELMLLCPRNGVGRETATFASEDKGMMHICLFGSGVLKGLCHFLQWQSKHEVRFTAAIEKMQKKNNPPHII